MAQAGLSCFDAFSVCDAGNSTTDATQCLGDFNSLYPGWNHSVVATACAGHSDATKVNACSEPPPMLARRPLRKNLKPRRESTLPAWAILEEAD